MNILQPNPLARGFFFIKAFAVIFNRYLNYICPTTDLHIDFGGLCMFNAIVYQFLHNPENIDFGLFNNIDRRSNMPEGNFGFMDVVPPFRNSPATPLSN